MNYQRLPSGSRDTLPALTTTGREPDYPYRGAGRMDFEQREPPLRVTLLKYLHLALKYKLLIAICVAVALFLGFVVTFLMPKVYSAATTVKIDRAAPKVLNSQTAGVEGVNDPQFYQTQYELIKSRSLAERVVVALNLGQTDFVAPAPSFLSRLLGRDAQPAPDAAAVQARQRQATDKVMAGLSVQPVAMSSIVRIRYASTDPRWAQRISVAAAEQYERYILDRRFSASGHARRFLDERLQELKVKLQDSERQLVEYAQQHGIVNVDEKRPESLANLQAIQTALAAAITNRLNREQLWSQAQLNNGLSLPQVMSDPLIQQARARIAQLQATYQEKLNVLKPAFPEMVALRAQITEAEKQIRAQIEVIRDSIKSEFETAQAQEAALAAKLEETKAEVLDVRGRSIEYTILMREVDTARSLYEGLLQQFRELGVAAEVDTNNVSIVDRAQVPAVPDSPSLGINLAISLLLGLVGAAGIIGVREALDDTYKSVEEIEEALNVAVLGVTPACVTHAGRSPFEEVRTEVTSGLAEAYRSLRTALQFSTVDGTPKTLLVTSARPGEGKSTTSASLALNFAQLGMNVLLIDADLRNPSMHHVLKVENAAGLSNLLAGAGEAADLVQASGIDGVTVMTTGPLPPNPAELLAGPRFSNLLSLAVENFDVVIIDGPPVMGLADAPIIASVAAGTLLVVEAGGTRRTMVRDALKRLEFARAQLVGVLLSKFDASKAGHTYGYGYAYSYGGDYYSYGRATKARLPGGDRETGQPGA